MLTPAASEQPLTFDCEGDRLLGILHSGSAGASIGVVIVVGGPQYRVGSHRQFLLLARRLAAAGIPVFRFDYRGMGDSGGEFSGFEQADQDIRAAIDCFAARVPGIERFLLWGLCDAASAVMMYAHSDTRVASLTVLNPWVRTETGQAQTLLRRYYLRRFTNLAFWRDLVTGKVALGKALGSLQSNIRAALQKKSPDMPAKHFIDRMEQGLQAFSGSVQLIISGDDLTAAEFSRLVAGSPGWQALLARPGTTQRYIEKATHTFSSHAWRSQVEEWTIEQVRTL